MRDPVSRRRVVFPCGIICIEERRSTGCTYLKDDGTEEEGVKIYHQTSSGVILVARKYYKPREFKGEDNSKAKLTEQIVIEARRRHKEGETLKKMAPEYGVSSTALSSAVRGDTWSHVKEGL